MSNHFISLKQAKDMTALYRGHQPKMLQAGYESSLLICETFDRAAFDALLAQKGAVALRFYYGMKPDLKVSLVAVAVDANNKDILPSETAAAGAGGDEGLIVDESRGCPDYCPEPPL